MISIISEAVNQSFELLIRAAKPATCGLEYDVPLPNAYGIDPAPQNQEGTQPTILSPGAATSISGP